MKRAYANLSGSEHLKIGESNYLTTIYSITQDQIRDIVRRMADKRLTYRELVGNAPTH